MALNFKTRKRRHSGRFAVAAVPLYLSGFVQVFLAVCASRSFLSPTRLPLDLGGHSSSSSEVVLSCFAGCERIMPTPSSSKGGAASSSSSSSSKQGTPSGISHRRNRSGTERRMEPDYTKKENAEAAGAPTTPPDGCFGFLTPSSSSQDEQAQQPLCDTDAAPSTHQGVAGAQGSSSCSAGLLLPIDARRIEQLAGTSSATEKVKDAFGATSKSSAKGAIAQASSNSSPLSTPDGYSSPPPEPRSDSSEGAASSTSGGRLGRNSHFDFASPDAVLFRAHQTVTAGLLQRTSAGMGGTTTSDDDGAAVLAGKLLFDEVAHEDGFYTGGAAASSSSTTPTVSAPTPRTPYAVHDHNYGDTMASRSTAHIPPHDPSPYLNSSTLRARGYGYDFSPYEAEVPFFGNARRLRAHRRKHTVVGFHETMLRARETEAARQNCPQRGAGRKGDGKGGNGEIGENDTRNWRGLACFLTRFREKCCIS